MVSSNVPTILTELSEKVADDDYEVVESLLDRLETEYEKVETQEEAQMQQVIAGRDSVDVTETTYETFDRYARHYLSVEMARASVLGLGGLYLTDPRQIESEVFQQNIDDLNNQEVSFVETGEETDSILDTLELPALITFIQVTEPGQVLKGERFTIETTVQNVGDATADTVAVEHESELPVSPKSENLSALSPDEQFSAEFIGDATVTGAHDIELSLTSTNAGQAIEQVTINIVDKSDVAGLAQSSIGDLSAQINESDEVTGGDERALIEELDSAEEKIERALEFIDENRIKTANNNLKAATRNMGAFLNSFEAKASEQGNGDRPTYPSVLVRSIVEQAEAIIDQLVRAQEAAP